MRTLIRKYAATIVIGFLCSITPQYTKAQGEVSFQVFYDGLSPYGTWVDYPGYGYVWRPNAGPDFAPYSTAGHWVYTDDYGWTWVSDYSWGWAPFHYGRWYYDDDYGWLWIPGDEWGPAWVSWSTCPGFYGWAPIGPGLFIGVGIPAERWCFVRERYIASPYVYRYYRPRTENVNYVHSSTVIERTSVSNGGRTTYVSGPRREDVERATGGHVTPVSVQSSSHPGQSVSGHQLSIYRPAVSKSTSASPHPAPTRVANLKDVPKRNGSNQKTASVTNNKTSNTRSSTHASSPSQKQVQPTHTKTATQQSHPTEHQQAPKQQVQHTQSQQSRTVQHQSQQAPRQEQVQHTQSQQHMMQQHSMPPQQHQMQSHQGGGPPVIHHEEGGKR